MIPKAFLLFIVPILVTGCIVRPNYRSPQIPVQDQWASDGIGEEPLTEWWTSFNDPLLAKYIEQAGSYNYDIRIAESNICYARAVRRGVSSQLYPQIDSIGNYTRFDISENFIKVGNLGVLQPQNFSVLDKELYTFGFDASWEIDLFGRIRRQVEGACARIGSAIEERNDIITIIFGDVARNYFEVRGTQALIQNTQKRIDLLSKELELVEERLLAGLDSSINQTTLETNLESLKSQLPGLYTQLYTSCYRLSVLTGQMPEALLEELLQEQPLPEAPEAIAVGLRSSLLRRRPDVRKAERELAASVADVGVAVAEFFPNIELRGTFFQQSLTFDNLWDHKSITWLTGGNIAAPIFHGGELRANLAANQALARASCQNYMKTVLYAIEEAESSLAGYLHQKQSRDGLKRSFARSQETIGRKGEQYREGMIGLLEFVQEDIRNLEVESNLIHGELDLLQKAVVLYKSLGGMPKILE